MSATLFEAVASKDLREVRRLLSEGQDPNTVDADGRSPLVFAAESKQWFSCVYLFLGGADPGFVAPNGSSWARCAHQSRSLQALAGCVAAKLNVEEFLEPDDFRPKKAAAVMALSALRASLRVGTGDIIKHVLIRDEDHPMADVKQTLNHAKRTDQEDLAAMVRAWLAKREATMALREIQKASP